FTLIELMVVIAIISILVAMLLPVLKLSKDKAKEIVCAGNLKQLNLAFVLYSGDYNEYYPPMVYLDGAGNWNPTWIGLLNRDKYSVPSLYDCPSSTVYSGSGPWTTSVSSEYGLNYSQMSLKKVTMIKSPSSSVLLADSRVPCKSWGDNIFIRRTHYNINGAYAVSDRHSRGCNVLFTDGHVLWYLAREIDSVTTWCP
ncbi:MAG: prepilin-type N-terminal cleavage/methylation domain-containing protein, partial [Victivallales bacterium]